VNKKVLVMAVALMVVAMLATPLFGTVSACGHGEWGQQIEKIPVNLGWMSGVPSPPEVWGVCGNWQYGRGGKLSYSGFFVVDIRTSPVTILLMGGSSLWTGDYIVNLKNGRGVLSWKVVITFPGGVYLGGTLVVPSGTFEGYVTQFGEFSIDETTGSAAQVSGLRYGVLRGDGGYDGWKLVISGKTSEGTGTTTFENYMYRPLP
jgi:hypothetical protein